MVQGTGHTWNEATTPVTPTAPTKPMREALSAGYRCGRDHGTTESLERVALCQSCKNPDSSKPHNSLFKVPLTGEVEEQDMETASKPIFGLRLTDKYKTWFYKPA